MTWSEAGKKSKVVCQSYVKIRVSLRFSLLSSPPSKEQKKVSEDFIFILVRSLIVLSRRGGAESTSISASYHFPNIREGSRLRRITESAMHGAEKW